jgi:hypothetical protein
MFHNWPLIYTALISVTVNKTVGQKIASQHTFPIRLKTINQTCRYHYFGNTKRVKVPARWKFRWKNLIVVIVILVQEQFTIGTVYTPASSHMTR